ncbi:MAG: hypothetical protein N3G20_00640, partial [Verrucomicrobiae bacterium]|nr:hypothetical protein [Verrucomicrobiae bacterium]
LGQPAGNRVATIHQTFVPIPEPPRISSVAELNGERDRVVAELRQKTFNAFPRKQTPPDIQVEFEFEDENEYGFRFAFTSEDGWRLHGRLCRPKNMGLPMPVLIAPRLPGDGRNDTRSFLYSIPFRGARVEFEPRGTGDTAWGEELNWHVRRAAAWTGRTIASMRVWDTLRLLTALRSLPKIGDGQFSLAAREHAAAFVAYAALLDGQIGTLFLKSPPGTQNAPGEKDGSGPALEMLYCLRITDLPEVVGLLFPTRIVVAGELPESYKWARELYARLGAPDNFLHVEDFSRIASA